MSGTNSTNTAPLSTTIALAFLMGFLAFAIMLGNAIVILAFVVDKKLRHRSTYFFLNLAISDFFVGAISIPLYIPQRLFDWMPKDPVCAFWHITDYLLCTASVYNIVLISYDRYQSVSNAVLYRAQQSETWKIVALMLAAWVLAFLVHGPVIMASKLRKSDRSHCEPELMLRWYVLAITLFLEFLVPVFSVAYFNIYIYWSLWKRGHFNRWQSHPGLTSASASNSGHPFSGGLFSQPSLVEPKKVVASPHVKKLGGKGSLLSSIRTQKKSNIAASKTSSHSFSDKLALHQREYVELLRARKLAKSLAILLGVFLITWAPYSLYTLVLSIRTPNQHVEIEYHIMFWLQWCNSLFNPLLYPLCHKRFQKAFLKIFCTKKQPLSPH
ncbi:histamine H4 receptor [Molossus molossus]|uniref:Histamine receptor H4 n=1 Tax=Molossus molossus TaxID=27622 RepID=A0A7J8HH46_MOLMO|nr:histamine H4 receptor [Molossus molossus]KAF6471400.1 histamine receptor H4 [Molossus molossus]